MSLSLLITGHVRESLGSQSVLTAARLGYFQFVRGSFLFITGIVHDLTTEGLFSSPSGEITRYLRNKFIVSTIGSLKGSFIRSANDYAEEYKTVMSGIAEARSDVFRVTDHHITQRAKRSLNLIRCIVGDSGRMPNAFPKRMVAASIVSAIHTLGLSRSTHPEGRLKIIGLNHRLGYSTFKQDDLSQEAEAALGVATRRFEHLL